MKYSAKFFRIDQKEITSDYLIDCVEQAKKFIVDSGISWEKVTIINNETNQVVDRLEYMKDMFSNGCQWKMSSLDQF